MNKMTHAPARLALLLLAALACPALPHALRAQTAPAKEAPASVEGRITDGEEGLAGVPVLLVSFDQGGRRRTVARARTDHEGRYRLTGAAPGRYQVVPSAPVFILPDATGFAPGRTLLLGAGDAVGDVDFRLTRGGVITGRVTDADGQPVVGEQVQLTRADKTQAEARASGVMSINRNSTDDRGVYRIYGLAAGRYRVSVGHDTETGLVRMGPARRFYRRTFHPDAVEESQARVVEVAAGGEATNVDITVGRAARTYSASGRFLGPDGQPAAGVTVGFGLIERGARNLGAIGGGSATNARGEFLLEGLAPGNYALFALPQNEVGSENYSDGVEFTLSDADVSGLEVKLRRGASVAGVVSVEGTSDRAVVARVLRQLRLSAQIGPVPGALSPPSFANVQVAPDGSFRLPGLRPGRLRIGLGWPQTPGLMLTRVELNGAEQRDGFEVAEGAQLTGVRVVVAYGNGVVRGQVNVANGTLAPDTHIAVFARRVVPGEDTRRGDMGRGAQADARGRFILEGLPAGEYEISARVFTPSGMRQQSARQQLSLPDGGEATVTLTLDLGEQQSPENF
jgi:protocatechuate 3,4-dioxygenase beta subunit